MAEYGVYEIDRLFDPEDAPDGHPEGMWNREDWDAAAEKYGIYRWYLFKYSEPDDPVDVAEDFMNEPGVELASPNALGDYDDIEPNDEYYPYQWHLYSDVFSSYMDAPGGWTWKDRLRIVNVGVVDTGIWSKHENYEEIHEDIKANVHRRGLDALPAFPQDECVGTYDQDEWWVNLWHGTRMASVISSHTDNVKGVAGVGWNKVRLVICKNCRSGDTNPRPDAFLSAKGILFCVAQGSEVVNMSWSFREAAPRYMWKIMEGAIWAAYDLGVSLVASTGNYGQERTYPAIDERVIAVAGITTQGNFAGS